MRITQANITGRGTPNSTDAYIESRLCGKGRLCFGPSRRVGAGWFGPAPDARGQLGESRERRLREFLKGQVELQNGECTDIKRAEDEMGLSFGGKSDALANLENS